MTTQWGRFDAQAERHLEALGFEDNLSVFVPSISYTAGEGYTVTYPNSADATVTAEVVPPSSESTRNEAGTRTDADIVLLVPDDTGVTWTGYGESGTGEVDTAVEVELSDGTRYTVTDVENQQDGLLRLEALEVEN